MPAERWFRAMGSDAHLVVVGPGPLAALDAAQDEIERLESRWSRFRPDSDLCALNEGAGDWVSVSVDTLDAVSLALEAWRSTAGWYDPTVLDALERAGYDRTFDQVRGSDDREEAVDQPAPGCVGIEVDRSRGAIRLPSGVHLDLGGIGKGLAADRVAAVALSSGAQGVCVNLGGDVRVAGAPPEGAGGWVVDADDQLLVSLADGAVATSSTVRRHWRRGGIEMHHLIDPFTGGPARRGVRSVTVVASEASWAEVLAKTALIAGVEVGADLVRDEGACALLVTEAGDQVRVGDIERFEVVPAGQGVA